MLLTRDDGYLLTDDRDRLDVERVHRWLSEDAYWALGCELSRVRASIAGSDCYGIYDAALTQVGLLPGRDRPGHVRLAMRCLPRP
jgi:hypothetical protein